MTIDKKREVIEEAFNYYHDRTSLTNKEEKELLNLVNELYEAISVTRCCEQLKVKEAISFEEYKLKWFIQQDEIIYFDKLTTELIDLNEIIRKYQEYRLRF